MLSFAVTSPYKFLYYNFFGVKFTGDASGIKTVGIVRSQRKDSGAGYNVKNNFTVDTLFTMDYQMQYNRDYVVKLEKKDDTITLFLDGKKIFREKLPTAELAGSFALASRGASVSYDYVDIKKGDTTILHDDFDQDSIKVFKVEARKVEK
jgi:hypothetical protein